MIVEELPQKKQLAFAFFSVFIGLILACLISELMLRAHPPFGLKEKVMDLNVSADGSFGSDMNWPFEKIEGKLKSLKPLSEFPMKHYEYNVVAHTDGLGGRLTSRSRMSDSQVVPFLGDSFAFGLGVRDEETYISLLGKQIDHRLLNLGVPGSSLSHQLNIIEWRHQELGSPSVYIFNFFCGNDFSDIDHEHLAHSERFKKGQTLEASIGFLNRFIFHRSFLRNSYLFQFLKMKLLNVFHLPYRDPVFTAMQKDGSLYREVEFYLDQDLKKLEQLAQMHHFTPLFILIPDKHQVNPKLLKQGAAYYGLNPSNLEPDLPNQKIRSKLDAYQIPYIDTTACFKKDADQLYFVYDGHLTAKGHQVMAECLSNGLKSKIDSLLKQKDVL